jgi:hypothetical protein
MIIRLCRSSDETESAESRLRTALVARDRNPASPLTLREWQNKLQMSMQTRCRQHISVVQNEVPCEVPGFGPSGLLALGYARSVSM